MAVARTPVAADANVADTPAASTLRKRAAAQPPQDERRKDASSAPTKKAAANLFMRVQQGFAKSPFATNMFFCFFMAVARSMPHSPSVYVSVVCRRRAAARPR